MLLVLFSLYIVILHTSEVDSSKIYDSRPRFEPSTLRFESTPLFVTQDYWVKIISPENGEKINIQGVKTGDPQFEVEGLHTKVPLPPGATRRVRIVFVPEVMGRTHTTIIVYTSMGEISLDVIGHGGKNVYELTPVSLRLSTNTPLRQKIRLRNHFPEVLKMERVDIENSVVDGCGDDIQFERRSRQIEPGGRATAAILHFQSATVGHFQGRFIIETSEGDVLSVPISLMVFLDDDSGVVEAESVDLGIMTFKEETRTRGFILRHNRREAVVVTHIELKHPDHCLTVGDIPDEGIKVPPDKDVEVVNITWRVCVEKRLHDLRGVLLVYSNTSLLEVEYRGQVVLGHIQWDASNVLFHFDTAKDGSLFKTPLTRAIRLVNQFPTPIELFSATIDHEDFTLLQFDKQVLKPGERYSGCRIKVAWTSNIFRYRTELVLETNITQIRIPLAVFDGHFSLRTSQDANDLFEVRTLNIHEEEDFQASESPADFLSSQTEFWHSPEIHQSKFGCKLCPLCCSLDEGEVHGVVDFGNLPKGAKVYQTVAIFNENPVPLRFEAFDEINNANYRLFTQTWKGDEGADFYFGQGFELVIGLVLNRKRRDVTIGPQETYLFFKAINEHMETQIMRIRVTWVELDGSLTIHPNPILFNPSFPGSSVQKISVVAQNTFNTSLYIGDEYQSDPRFIFDRQIDVLPPNSRMEIGTLEFDPGITESADDYFSAPDRDYSSYSRKEGPRIEELKLITERIRKWSQKRAEGKTKFNALLELLFHNLGSVHVMMQGNLQLPQLTTDVVDFGGVSVGQKKQDEIKIRNPFSFPIKLQLLNPVSDVFSVDTDLKQATGVAGPYQTISLGPIIFEPTAGKDFLNHIYIRNNITGLESVKVIGSGNQGVLVFGESGAQLEDLDSIPSEIRLPFHYNKLGIDISSDVKLSTNFDPGKQAEESFVVKNSGNQAVVLENLYLVEEGSEVGEFNLGCASPSEQGNASELHGMQLSRCDELPLTIAPRQQKVFHLQVHYPDDGPMVQNDLVAATSWGFFRTTVRFEVPLEVFSLLISLRPKRNEQHSYLILLLMVVVLTFFSCQYFFPLEDLHLWSFSSITRTHSEPISEPLFQEVESQNSACLTPKPCAIKEQTKSESKKPKLQKVPPKITKEVEIQAKQQDSPPPKRQDSPTEPDKPSRKAQSKRKRRMKKKRRQGSAKKAAEAARQQSQASDLDSKKESLKKASPSSSPSPKKKMSPKQTPVKSPQKASNPPSPKEKKPTAADAQDFVVVGKPSESMTSLPDTRLKSDSFASDRAGSTDRERSESASTTGNLAVNIATSGKESVSNDSEVSTSVESLNDGYSVSNEPPQTLHTVPEDTEEPVIVPFTAERPPERPLVSHPIKSSSRPIRRPSHPIKSPHRETSNPWGLGRTMKSEYTPRDRRPTPLFNPSTSPSPGSGSLYTGSSWGSKISPRGTRKFHSAPSSGSGATNANNNDWNPMPALWSPMDNTLPYTYTQGDEAVGIKALNSPTLRPTPIDDRTPPLPTLESSSSLSRRSSTKYGPIGTNPGVSNFYQTDLYQPLQTERMERDVEALLKDDGRYQQDEELFSEPPRLYSLDRAFSASPFSNFNRPASPNVSAFSNALFLPGKGFVETEEEEDTNPSPTNIFSPTPFYTDLNPGAAEWVPDSSFQSS